MVSAAATGALAMAPAASGRVEACLLVPLPLGCFNRAFTDCDPLPADVQTVMTLGVFSAPVSCTEQDWGGLYYWSLQRTGNSASRPAVFTYFQIETFLWDTRQTPQSLTLSFWET